MGVLEAIEGMARTEEAFRLTDTVNLVLQRCNILSPAFQAVVLKFMKLMLERLARTRCVGHPDYLLCVASD